MGHTVSAIPLQSKILYVNLCHFEINLRKLAKEMPRSICIRSLDIIELAS